MHSVLHPIELVWGQMNDRVVKGNTSFRLEDVEQLTPKAITKVMAETLRKTCSHLWRIEENHWKSDGIQDSMWEQLAIDHGDDCDVDSGGYGDLSDF